MPFYQAGLIRYFKFSSMELPGIYHAVFSRQGGVSPAPWESLNFGGSVSDDVSRVRQNRNMALTSIGVNPASVYDVYQVHSTDVFETDRPFCANETHVKADAIITNRHGITLLMRFADCVPILLYDPVGNAVGIIHAGWIGTINKIVAKTVNLMTERYGTNPNQLVAAIGPSIGPDHYSVRSDVIEKVQLSFQQSAGQLITHHSGISYLDLWKANSMTLKEAGVQNIEVAGICTHCNLEDWYSHRGEGGKTGRFGAIIGLR